MKTITGIKERLSHFNPDLPQEVRDQLPPFQQMFVSCLGGSQAENGDQAIAMYELGVKVKNAPGPDLDVEDAEFKVLKEKCQKNALGWVAHYHAQILMRLKEAEEAKK